MSTLLTTLPFRPRRPRWLSRNQQTIQDSSQITLVGPVKLAVNLRAPCGCIHHLDVVGSKDESSERKSGHLKLDLNGEKYQLYGHVMRSNGTAEVALMSQTGYQEYELVVLNAKYDARQPTYQVGQTKIFLGERF